MTTTCLLITGMGHSGTRLLVHMLAKHPDISVPLTTLNFVAEFRPLHRFFIYSMDHTPLHSEAYVIDPKELAFVLDAYMQKIDTSKKFCVLKLPYYPLNCLGLFVDYFDSQIKMLFSVRPVEKVVKSFLNRNEDQLFFEDDPDELFRQIKKLTLEQRKQFLADPNPTAFFHTLDDRCTALRNQWDAQHPEQPFVNVDVEKIATSRDYLTSLLQSVGLDASDSILNTMLSVVDEDRLLHHKTDPTAKKGWRSVVRNLVPPVIWKAASRIRSV